MVLLLLLLLLLLPHVDCLPSSPPFHYPTTKLATQTSLTDSHNVRVPGWTIRQTQTIREPRLPDIMADPTRYSGRYAPASGRRSPVYNPARSSLPVGVNYAPYADPYAADPYGGDIHVMSISHHDSMMPIRAPGDYRTNSIPVTTTTYAVKKDREPASSISRSTSVREGSASGRPHRSSTLDSSKRPPIIITTKHASPPSSSSHAPSNTRSDSPARDPYRTSEEGQYYAQPGTSIHRARSTNRAPAPYSAALDNDEYARLRERTGDERLRAGAYRPPRDPPIYPYEPRHAAVVDIGNEGYEYTKPSDLARYDLDTTRPPRHNRRDSFDHGYHRPSVSVSTDIGGRPYEQNERRSRGPPPTTRGLDKINRTADAGIYDPPVIRMPIPPPAPLAPNPRSGHLSPGSPPAERRSTSRTRPVSLYQEGGYPRDPYYQRDARDRDYFQDDVTTRGFGLRIDPKDVVVDDVRREPREPESRRRDERRDKRDSRLEDRDPRRRSDEDLQQVRRRDDRKDYVDPELPVKKDNHKTYEDLEPVKRRDDRKEYIDPEPVKRRDDRKDYVDPEPPVKKDTRKTYEDRSPRRRSDDEWEFIPRKEDRKEARDSKSPPEIRVFEEDADRKSRREDAPVRDGRDARDRDPVDRVDDDGDDRKDRIKDKVAAGLGIAAAAIGLGSALKDKDSKDSKDDRKDGRKDDRKDERSSHRRSRDSDDLRSWESGGEDVGPSDRHRSSRRNVDDRRGSPKDDIEIIDPPRDRDDDRSRRERPAETSDDTRYRNHRAAEAALTGEALDRPSRDTSASSADATSSRPRRKLRASGFNPNDTSDLAALKAQLAAKENQGKPDRPDRSPPTIREPSAERRSPTTEEADKFALVPASKDDDGRGRELVAPAPEERQVRVVSPPRDKDEKKPVKGILKQPKPQFPEEPNPIREGVAPHKTDKTKADVPPGARWTKINRSLVNPDALTIGKERFEVRDDFVIVLRVLSKEEIQAYATATAQLRGMRNLSRIYDSYGLPLTIQ